MLPRPWADTAVVRLYLAIAAALALVGGLWYVRHLQTSRDAYEARATQAEATIDAERKARAHEKEIADRAVNQFQTAITGLQTELAGRPLKPVIIRVPVRTSVPEDGAASAPIGTDASAEGREPGTVEKDSQADITAELTGYMLDCQINSLQLESLQNWVRSR